MAKQLAEGCFSCGRSYLSVAGICVAIEGDRCREAELPDEVYEPIPADELATATIGGKPVAGMESRVVRFFRGSNWTDKMLEYVAEQINKAAKETL